MVVKAMSWALRELSKRDSGAVRQFLIDHRDQLASRVIREVGNKLATGLKSPKRQSD
jgi:3-methyladenine DNA glycosylase AlkD